MAQNKQKTALELTKMLSDEFDKLSKGKTDYRDADTMRKIALAQVRIIRNVKKEQENAGQSVSKVINDFLSLTSEKEKK